ncbi:MAG: GNAT family N-acetyltransferase [Clostridiales Family XIII bacterium]|jgi:GNAT superfamily N-acetyltransferase|nr:GNAT family N-acetyltransferase [Clostridiales Family XIII bacterium]
MQTGCITQENFSYFHTLLLPNAVSAIEAGEPLTALALVEEGAACGAAAGYLTDDSFVLSSLYVAPEYRRRGGGRRLLEAYLSLLEKTEDDAARTLTVYYTVTRPEHEELAPFLTALGFTAQEEEAGTIFLSTLGEAAATPFFVSGGEKSDAISSFAEVPKAYLAEMTKRAERLDVPLPEYPLYDDKTEKDISVCVMDGKRIASFLSFDFSCGGLLTLSCVYAENPVHIPVMFRRACRLAEKKYPPETPFAVQTVNNTSAELLQAVLPAAQSISFAYRRDVPFSVPAANR